LKEQINQNVEETMNPLRSTRTYLLLLCSLTYLPHSLPAFSQTASAEAGAQPAGTKRDGQHDFDFNIGTWKTRISRLQHPLTGSATWIEMEGTVVVRKVWDGRAQLEEIEADGSTGHFEGLTLFLYNPVSHQWSLNFANGDDGTMSQPSIGEFKNGRGEFFDQEVFNGRTIMVRIVWSDITADSHRFEQAFSDDGGKTWEINFIAMLTREMPAAPETSAPHSGAPDGPHDFDFNLGTWKEHSSRLQHPLTGSTAWIEMAGTSVFRKIWNGRGQIVELESDGSAGHLELLSLRLYNPQARQWSLSFATSKVGVLGMPPTIGDFKNGRGEFYDQELSDGRAIWVRFTVFPITPDSAQSEQAFSDDGGKTWETNWVNKYARVKDESNGTH
jgi:hypothetical protein